MPAAHPLLVSEQSPCPNSRILLLSRKTFPDSLGSLWLLLFQCQHSNFDMRHIHSQHGSINVAWPAAA